jgi:opacity protein-like surface antigen
MRLRWLLLWACLAGTAFGQRHEVGLTLGGLVPQDRLEGGLALQANYGLRLWRTDRAQVSFETHWLANTQRKVGFADPAATSDVATMYVTPGLRFTFAPGARVRPWVAAGAGWAWYEHSELTQGGQPNGAPRNLYRGAFQFGGGVDWTVWKRVALRAEVRDFVTGSPAFNRPGLGGAQHNVVAGGGIVLRFGE